MRKRMLLTAMLAVALTTGLVFAAGPRAGEARIVPELRAILADTRPDEPVAVIVQTRWQADLAELPTDAGYDEKVEHLQSVAASAQREFLDWLTTTDATDVQSFWLVSRVALSATPTVILELAERSDVGLVYDDFVVTLDIEANLRAERPRMAADGPDAPEWNIAQVKAQECWAEGYTGTGVVVGNIDTGVEVTHPAFGLNIANRWRSTNGWFDGVQGRNTPYDDNQYSHGTHCMGVAVGGEGVGVAPRATFIAAKGFNSAGSGQTSWISACLDWMAGTGRPDVLSNSWSRDRTDTYWFGPFNNLRELGIVVVAAVGNHTPDPAGPGTSFVPASFPVTIGVGATNSADAVENFSRRGPAPNANPWNNTAYWPRPDWDFINPEIVAPGRTIRSAVGRTEYEAYSGTSTAAPHIAGAAAILLQKDPALTPVEIFNLLADNADRPPAGGSYPNNDYGWGRLNCKTALDNVGNPMDEDTLRVHHAYGINGIGEAGMRPFYTAARLTPLQDADVIGGYFLQHVPSHDQHFFFWEGNTETRPGAIIDSVPYSGAGSGWKRVELAEPFRVNRRQDFWLGPRFHHDTLKFPAAVDEGPPEVLRGGWVNWGDGWYQLMDLRLPYNWMIGAIVRYPDGVEELLLPTVRELLTAAPTILHGPGRLSYSVPATGPVELSVYDITGQRVRTLVKGTMPAGEHSAVWDRADDRGRRVAAGVYSYRLTVGGRTFSVRSAVLD